MKRKNRNTKNLPNNHIKTTDDGAKSKYLGTTPILLLIAFVSSSTVIKKENTNLCCTGGIPSFSSTLSLILSMVSVGSMSISISFPVRVFTLIMVPPLSRKTR